MSNKCIDCKHLNKELAFCRACGVKWLKETDGEYCKHFEKTTSPTVFDRITKSPDVLAETLVYQIYDIDGYEWWTSTLCNYTQWELKSKAITATVAKLKEVCDE